MTQFTEFNLIECIGECQRSCRPEIIDHSYANRIISWSTPFCGSNVHISQFLLLFDPGTQTEMQVTNITHANFSNINSTCAVNPCHFLVKAEFDDNSVSQPSSCLQINSQIQERKCM